LGLLYYGSRANARKTVRDFSTIFDAGVNGDDSLRRLFKCGINQTEISIPTENETVDSHAAFSYNQRCSEINLCTCRGDAAEFQVL